MFSCIFSFRDFFLFCFFFASLATILFDEYNKSPDSTTTITRMQQAIMRTLNLNKILREFKGLKRQVEELNDCKQQIQEVPSIEIKSGYLLYRNNRRMHVGSLFMHMCDAHPTAYLYPL